MKQSYWAITLSGIILLPHLYSHEILLTHMKLCCLDQNLVNLRHEMPDPLLWPPEAWKVILEEKLIEKSCPFVSDTTASASVCELCCPESSILSSSMCGGRRPQNREQPGHTYSNSNTHDYTLRERVAWNESPGKKLVTNEIVVQFIESQCFSVT